MIVSDLIVHTPNSMKFADSKQRNGSKRTNWLVSKRHHTHMHIITNNNIDDDDNVDEKKNHILIAYQPTVTKHS